MKLAAAAESQFEELASLCGGASRTVAISEWQGLDPSVSAIFPDWCRNLVSRHAIAGVAFDIDTEDHQIFGIAITEPGMMPGSVEELCESHWGFRPLIESDYFPLGFTQDGDIFVARRNLPTGIHAFEPESDGKDGFIPAVAEQPHWKDISDFAAELIPDDFDG